jgi:A nuclease family of the HNH/ENDO VII superfamily with conserved AHH
MKEENNSQGSNSSLIAGQPAPTPRTPLRVVPKPRVNPLRVVPPTTVPEVVFARASNGIIFRRVVGQGVTRFIPLVGWGLLANDLVELAEQGIESLQPNGGTVGGSNFELAPVPPPSTPPSETITYWQGTVFPDPFSWFPGYVYGELNNGRGRTDGDVREYNPSTNYDPPTTDISEPPVTPDTFPGQLADPVELPFPEAPQQPLPPDPTPRPGDIPMTMGGSFIPVLPKPTEPETNPTNPPVLPHPLDITFDRINTDRPGPRIPGENNPNIFRDPRTLQPRASQEPENTTNNQSEPAGETSEDSTPTDPAIAAREAKKAEVEQEVVGLRLDEIPSALEERLFREGGYVIRRPQDEDKTSPSIAYYGTTENGEKVKTPSGSQLYLEQRDGAWVIQPGRSLGTSNRTSDPYTMKKNAREAKGVEQWPANEGLQVNHLIPDNVAQKSPLAQRFNEVNGRDMIDEKENLIVMPEKAAAVTSTNADVQALRETDNITHRGSHANYNQRVKEKLKAEEAKLVDEYGSLENVPKDVIIETFTRVQKELRQELKDSDTEIGAGKYHELPQAVKEYLTPDKNNPGKYRLSDLPNSQKTNQVVVGNSPNPMSSPRLASALRAFTAKLQSDNIYNDNQLAMHELQSEKQRKASMPTDNIAKVKSNQRELG